MIFPPSPNNAKSDPATFYSTRVDNVVISIKGDPLFATDMIIIYHQFFSSM